MSPVTGTVNGWSRRALLLLLVGNSGSGLMLRNKVVLPEVLNFPPVNELRKHVESITILLRCHLMAADIQRSMKRKATAVLRTGWLDDCSRI